MSKHFNPKKARGTIAVRADESNLTQMFVDLNATFEQFRASIDEKDAELAKRFDDVVTTEKIDRINAAIGDLQESHQAELDRINASVAALGLNGTDGGGEAVSPEMREFNASFEDWFRTGGSVSEVEAAYDAEGVMAAMSVGSDPDGGYTAPVEWDREITRALREVTPMRQYASVRNVTGQGYRHLFNTGGTDSGWVGEEAARPETNTSQLLPYEFAFGEIYANPAATRSMLQDSLLNIEQFIADEVELEFAAQEANAFVSGDGVNKPKGIMQYTETAETALAANLRHPLGHIKEVNSGHATDITVDGLIDVLYDVPDERITPNSSWFANKKTFGQIRKMKNNDGDLIWQMPLQAGEPATILGHTVRALSGMPNVAANAMPIGFGDMKRAYRIFDRAGVQVLRDALTKKPFVLFYTTKRVGGGLWNPEYFRYHKIAVNA